MYLATLKNFVGKNLSIKRHYIVLYITTKLYLSHTIQSWPSILRYQGLTLYFAKCKVFYSLVFVSLRALITINLKPETKLHVEILLIDKEMVLDSKTHSAISHDCANKHHKECIVSCSSYKRNSHMGHDMDIIFSPIKLSIETASLNVTVLSTCPPHDHQAL